MVFSVKSANEIKIENGSTSARAIKCLPSSENEQLVFPISASAKVE